MDIYTMHQWQQDRTFSALPGQEIEEAVYNELFNCMPPLQLSREAIEHTDIPVHAGFMMGEPHSCDKAGQLFLAFGMNDYGNKKRYFFLGMAHKDKKLNGVYYQFDCMNAFINDGLFPCSEFADDAEAIRKAADYEATLYKYEYREGVRVSIKVLYEPMFL